LKGRKGVGGNRKIGTLGSAEKEKREEKTLVGLELREHERLSDQKKQTDKRGQPLPEPSEKTGKSPEQFVIGAKEEQTNSWGVWRKKETKRPARDERLNRPSARRRELLQKGGDKKGKTPIQPKGTSVDVNGGNK